MRLLASLAMMSAVAAACGGVPRPAPPGGGSGSGGGSGAGSGSDGGMPGDGPSGLTISRVNLDGAGNTEIRQGGSATLVITGTGLDHVTAARLGDLDLDLAASSGTATELRLPVAIPHGHAIELLDLTLSSADGSAHAAAVGVSPITIMPNGRPDARGTSDDPLSLCGIAVAERGDEVELFPGTFTCSEPFTIARGVTVHGAASTHTIVRGSSLRVDTTNGDPLAPTAIERLTLEDGEISAAFTTLSVTDVAIHDTSGLNRLGAGISMLGGQLTVTNLAVTGFVAGIQVDANAAVTADHYTYANANGIAIAIDRGDVQARNVTADPSVTGVILTAGSLDLADSTISSDGAAIHAGDFNTTVDTRTVTVANTLLRSNSLAITEATTDLTLTGCTLQRGAGHLDQASRGLQLFGGTVALIGTTVSGFSVGLAVPPPFKDRQGVEVTRATLDQIEIAATDMAIGLQPLVGGDFIMRRSHAVGQNQGLVLGDGLDIIDLGTAGSPGDNQLENASGGFALDDRRNGGTVDLHGTTLNGTGFDGQVVQGPASVAAAYTLSGTDTLRF